MQQVILSLLLSWNLSLFAEPNPSTTTNAPNKSNITNKTNPPMTPQAIDLWPEKPKVTPDREYLQDQRVYSVDNPSLIPLVPTQPNGTAVVIFPGGGYTRLAIYREGYELAPWFLDRGITVFLVKYRMKEYGFPAPLLDAQRAVRWVRSHASEWKIDPTKIGVMGFSAGGHVAANLATHFDFVTKETVATKDPLSHISARPDFLVLGYPVITMEKPSAHQGSRKNLLGENADENLIHFNSLETQVTPTTPPVFMFHGVMDQSVPVSNSLMFFEEVLKHNANSELHLYQSNIHGIGMVKEQGSMSEWPTALENWLKLNAWL